MLQLAWLLILHLGISEWLFLFFVFPDWVFLCHCFNRFLEKWVWHFCQLDPWNCLFIALTRPLWLSDINQSWWFQPSLLKDMKNSSQLVSDSLSDRWNPRISCYSSSLTPIAIKRLLLLTLWLSLTLM